MEDEQIPHVVTAEGERFHEWTVVQVLDEPGGKDGKAFLRVVWACPCGAMKGASAYVDQIPFRIAQ